MKEKEFQTIEKYQYLRKEDRTCMANENRYSSTCSDWSIRSILDKF